jgi:SAM-dependent methyltransferase
VVHRITDAEIQQVQAEYKRNYQPFRQYFPKKEDLVHVAHGFSNLVATQNGQDTDDYCVGDNNKVEKYLSYLPKGSDVLILGVGTGRETLVAKEFGLKAVGTTLGSRNIDFGLNQLNLTQDEHIECLNEALPFPSDSFDAVAGFQVFEHAISPLLFLLEQSRVLRLGGKLLLEWPPADKFSMEDNPHHQICYSPGQAYALFQKAGFSDIKVYYDDLTPIEDKDMWAGDQIKMLCIEGTRTNNYKDYILRARSLR